MTAKLTQEEFEKQVYEIWGDSLDLSQAVYKNCSHKMWIRCKEHDIWFEQNYEKLVRRKQCGCPECAKRKHKANIWMIRDTQEDFIARCVEIYGECAFCFDKVHYVNASTKIVLHCNKCHEDFEITPNKLLTRKKGCTHCSKRNRGKRQTDAYKGTFEEEMVEIFGDLYTPDMTTYVNRTTPMQFFCNKHKVWFTKSPSKLLDREQGCDVCSKEAMRGGKLLTQEECLERCLKSHKPGEYDYNKVEYKGRAVKICIKCNSCGDYFWQLPDAHWKGCGCPACSVGFSNKLPSVLYLVADDPEAPTVVKIGVSNKFERRLQDLRNSTPFPIYVLKVFTFEAGCATLQLEQLAHTAFADRNCHFEGFDGCTEWFWYSHEILEFIENNC